MTNARFGEVITAMVTPFAPDGSVDIDAARSLATRLVDQGSDGLVVSGTTGESPTLRHGEKLALFEAVVAEVGDKAAVIAGTGTYDTAESVTLTVEAGERGVDACLVVTPYYSKPPQNGLLAHFTAVAEASTVPVMIYDIPGRTGRRVEPETMVALAKHDRIVAVKDAVGDALETARLRSMLDDAGHHDFEIYSGDDGLLLPHVAVGAVGIVSVCSHLVGHQMKQLFAAWNDGKTDEAANIFFAMRPLVTAIMGVTASPIPVKAALEMLGAVGSTVRLPLVPATELQAAEIRAVLEAQGLL